MDGSESGFFKSGSRSAIKTRIHPDRDPTHGFQDVRNSVDHVHMRGDLKDRTCENLDLYVQKDER